MGTSVTTAINFNCPNCHSKPGEQCTQPTNDSRVKVPWFHSSRQYEVEKENDNVITEPGKELYRSSNPEAHPYRWPGTSIDR